ATSSIDITIISSPAILFSKEKNTQMKKTMQGLCKFFVQTIVLLVFSLSAMAQNVVSGKITDKEGAPVPAVTITLKGTRTSTQTGSDGTYRITAPAGTT